MFGGKVSLPNAIGQMWKLDKITDLNEEGFTSWTHVASMTNARTNFAFGLLYGKIYVAAGNSASSVYVLSIEEYDPTTDTWTTLTNDPLPFTGWQDMSSNIAVSSSNI
jgi:N-acetylneuraminic acid mutarotase